MTTPSMREQILESIKSRIEILIGNTASVSRSLTDAYEVDDQDVVVIHRGFDNVSEDMLGAADHTLEVLISVVTRSSVPDRKADEYFILIHPMILTFSDLDIIDVSAGKTDEPKYGGESGKVVMITSRYYIQYRTSSGSLVD